ncbi:hypothetical protein KJQ97_09195 [Campylobacter sp. 2018MI01]|uniref:hypothetical protein n=1 Tax=Campylobacter sp. 2018MI01 TaxID=2836735 RepID=UPI001BDAA2EC|nr:hypothetical protein [Campylobacter sp. 2018MI01]MBT0879598.1 hypothetical protein [Campylobacter sp. 2018MI01]
MKFQKFKEYIIRQKMNFKNFTEDVVKKEQKKLQKIQTKKMNCLKLIKIIKLIGKTSFIIGQFLLLSLIITSAISYGFVYMFKLKYPLVLTFEQFLTFGFSNLFAIALIILLTYMPIEAIISFSVMKIVNFFDVFMKYLVIATIAIMQFFILLIMSKFDIITLIVSIGSFLMFFALVFRILSHKTEINTIRFAWACIAICHFCFLNYNTSAATGLGDYNATIMVDKNSFIKDMFDGFYNKNNKYHYKGNYIELKDVKILSTLGDIAYVELCSKNMEIGKTLEKDCKKTIRVEFIKKDIHIIRDGKKQNVTNTENDNDKTNNESKERNEQDLDKSNENNKEEKTTKNN